MKILFLTVALSTIVGVNCNNMLIKNAKLIEEFLEEKYISSVNILSCCLDSKENVKILKRFSARYKTAVFSFDLNHVIETDLLKNGKTLLILNISCENSQRYLENANNKLLLGEFYTWLMYEDGSRKYFKDANSIKDYFAMVPLRMDTDLTVVISNEIESERYDLFEVYNPGFDRGGKVRVHLVGVWNQNCSKKIFWCTNDTLYQKRLLMSDVALRTPTVITKPYNGTPEQYLTNAKDKAQDVLSKCCYSIFVHFQEIHNFTMILTAATQWFGNTLNGTDAGLSYLFNNDLADISSASALIKKPRVGTVDFIVPVYPFRTCFIFRNPGVFGNRGIINIFFQPFAPKTWHYVIGFCAVICTMLKVSYWMQRVANGNNNQTGDGDAAEKEAEEAEEDTGIVAAFLVIWSAFCQQGTSLVPRHVSGRIIFLSLLVLCLLLYNYYTSIVVSSLLSAAPPGFRTLAELARSKMQVGMEDIIYVRTLFNISKDPDVRYLYRRKVFPAGAAAPAYYPPEEGLRRVRGGGFAYHTETSTAYPYIEATFEPAEICDLLEITMMQPSVLSYIGQKLGPYRNTLAVSVRRMIEKGIVSRQMNVWKARKPPCLSATSSLVTVGIEQILPAILVLVAGIFASLLILCVEMSTQSRKRSNNGTASSPIQFTN